MSRQPKFQVEISYEDGDPSYSHSRYLADVKPKSLSLECPHCGVYSSMILDASVRQGPDWRFDFICRCPHCEESVFVQARYVEEQLVTDDWGISFDTDIDTGRQDPIPASCEVIAIYPYRSQVAPLEIPEPYRTDYREAVLVLDISPKASAALSRRILQAILREQYDIRPENLQNEIREFVGRSDIPSYIREAVDAIRKIGNLAAHPIKNKNTGEIVDVEPGEAEWLIETLEDLIDFTFMKRKKTEERQRRLEEKLEAARQSPRRQ